MNIDIFGSCITRDAFSFNSNKYNVGYYNARSSLISASSTPYHDALPETQYLTSNFQKKSLYNDLSKNFSKYAKKPKSNTIIIDLFDERFDLVEHNQAYYTLSNEFIKAKLNLAVNKVSKAEHLILFNKNIVRIKKLFSNYNNVILHKIRPNIEYFDNGVVKKQDFTKNSLFLYNNIDYYFDILEQHIPNLKIIEIKGYIGDVNHKWGNSSLHYEDEYYHEFNKALDFVLNNDENYYSQKNQFEIERKSNFGFEININNDNPTAIYVYKNKEVVKKLPYSSQKKRLVSNLSPGKYRFKFFVKGTSSTNTFLSKYVSINNLKHKSTGITYILDTIDYNLLWTYQILKGNVNINGILVDDELYSHNSELNLSLYSKENLPRNSKILTTNLDKTDDDKYEIIEINVQSDNILNKYLSTLGAVKLYRLSRILHINNHDTGAAYVWNYMKKASSCSISYKSNIGEDFELGLGGLNTVIHPLATIGNNVKIAQQVTVGFNGAVKGLTGPEIGNNVYIAPGSMCLGGKIGDNVIIGANSTVLNEIPSNCVVAGSPAKIISTDIEKYKNYLPLKEIYKKHTT